MNKPDFNVKNVTDSVSGQFVFRSPKDQWLIDRTRIWLMHHCNGAWRYKINMDQGRLTFEFELQSDVNGFRTATAQDDNLITCV